MRATALWAASAIALASCSQPHSLRLINNTGGDVVLRVANEASTDLPPEDLVVTLKPDAGRTVLEGHAAVRGVRLSKHGCDYRFDFPRLDVYAWTTGRRRAQQALEYTYPIYMQVEPDFTIYLAKRPGKRPLTVNELRGLQAHGFPLRPTSTTCA